MNTPIKRLVKLGILITGLALINGIVFAILYVNHWQAFLQGFVSVLLGLSILVALIPVLEILLAWYLKD